MDINQAVDTLKNFTHDFIAQLIMRWQGFLLWVAQQFSSFAKVLEGWGVPAHKSLASAYLVAYVVLGLLLSICIWRLVAIRRRQRAGTVTALPQEDKSIPAKPPAPVSRREVPQPEADATQADLAEAVGVAVPAAEEEQTLSVYERMRNGLAKTHKSLFGKLDVILGAGTNVDADTIEEIEEVLVSADFGVKTTQKLVAALQARLSRGEMRQPDQVRKALREEILAILSKQDYTRDINAYHPYVMMVVGVNGVGKTTTIGKLAHQYKQQGKRVLLGAGDTFRAAAADQLAVWGERADVAVVRHAEGADPAAVAFDAAKAAVAREAQVLIIDTAGRLHTKVNLMEEMKKIRRVLEREIPAAPHETLLVLDATTGQNALIQARLFQEAVAIDGIILTKLDGTARGGMAVAIAAELQVPVRYIGVGEGVEDLRPFDPEMFVDALFENH
ncbi:MAG: signal recognition particle-docking protein FtsY [Desulfuromonadaceae bacterium]|nr:signal recognition particle-docking protein FtsY [Desulfuromonadaceae bacterium]